MTITLYGIPNCDTVKKARTWLPDHGIDFTFHDFKKQGLDAPNWSTAWLQDLDWDDRWSTARAPPGATCPTSARRPSSTPTAHSTLMLENPSVIKRPVLARRRPAARSASPPAAC